MTLIRWEPRRDVDVAQRRMRRLFDDFDTAFQNGFHLELGTFSPRVDISENAEKVLVHAELPGIDPKNVKLSITEGVLTIRGEKKRNEAHNELNFHRIERSHGEFVREFTLPTGLDEDAVTASYADGVLEIAIPKLAPVKPKEREIEINIAPKTV